MELIAQHGWYFISLAIGSLVAGALAIFWYCRSLRQNARLMSALNNMSEGLCMFDASARLILCNERYVEMYGLSPEIARPGCSLRDLLEHRRRANTFEGDADAYIADARAHGRRRDAAGRAGDTRRPLHCHIEPPHAEGRLGRHPPGYHRAPP
jgi:PAS domain-containing protein